MRVVSDQQPAVLADGLAEVLEELGGRMRFVSDEELAALEAERQVADRTQRLMACGIATVLPAESLTLVARAQIESTQALDIVRRWIAYQHSARQRGSQVLLALVGSAGVGKTVAAAWLLAERGGRYVEAEELCRLHAARWGEERASYERLVSSALLVVDELGTEEDAARSKATWRDVVNRRQSKLTLLLGNVSRAKLRERLDPRTVDRIRAMGTVIHLEGQSLRRGDGL